MSIIKQFLAAAALCPLFTALFAHELQANRLTVVLRDDTHVSLTYFIDYPAALHRALAPKRPMVEFIGVYSAMKPADFQKELSKAQAKFTSSTRLAPPAGTPLTITNWQWPEPARVQALLQERAMQALVASGEHAYEAALEVHAEATSPRNISSIAAQLPEEFGKVLVISYLPRQAWAAPGAAPTPIKF